MTAIKDFTTKAWNWYSDAHTILSLLKDKDPSKQSSGNDNAGAKADLKGTGQMDERLTLTAFARAIKKFHEDSGFSLAKAENRALKVLRVMNSYNPLEIRCLSLTFGLEQDTPTSNAPNTSKKNKQGKGGNKEPKPTTKAAFENKAGQDMFILLIRKNNDEFTREFCDFAISSTQILGHNIAKWQEHAINFLIKSDERVARVLDDASDYMSNILPLISLEHPNGTFRPPIWTDFLPFWMRKRKIEECRQKYLADLRQQAANQVP